MKKTVLLFILLQSAGLAFSQSNVNNEAIERKVNEQVWKPFKEAFDSRNWKKFNNLHTDDVLRVSKWGIKLGSEYKESVVRSYSKKDAPKRTIDFRLEQRIYSINIGYEVGYYRIKYDLANDETKVSYAQFHVLLKKKNGKWKIAQDWDSDQINGASVTADDFAKGIPLKL